MHRAAARTAQLRGCRRSASEDHYGMFGPASARVPESCDRNSRLPPRTALAPSAGIIPGDVDRRHGDLAAEADVDVAPRPADSRLVIAGIDGLAVLEMVGKGQGGRIERAKDDFGIGFVGPQVRED